MSGRSVAELLSAVDDRTAWDELVERYARLVWSVARSFHLDDAATADVTQAVWLRLIEHRDRIREPERLASWLATTTRHEAIAVQRSQHRASPTDRFEDRADRMIVDVDDTVVTGLEESKLRRDLRVAFVQLSESCQQLLRLVTAEPKIDYATISELIGRPIGSIGPTRARCLERLRSLLGEAQAPAAPT